MVMGADRCSPKLYRVACSQDVGAEEGCAFLQRLFPKTVAINGNECTVELNITLNNLLPGSRSTAAASSLDAEVEQSSVS